MMTPKRVFKYSSAATAGYAFTLPIAGYVGRLVTRLVNITLICAALAATFYWSWTQTNNQHELDCAEWSAIAALISATLLLVTFLLYRRFWRRPG